MQYKILRSLIVLAAAFLVAKGAPAQTGAGTAAPSIRYGFAVEWSRERVSSKNDARKDTSGIPMSSTTSNTFVGHVKVTNRSSAPLQDLEVHIQMHYKAVDGKTQTDEHKDSVRTIATIRPNETVTVDTDPLVLKVFELKGGYYFADGTPARQTDSIRGGVVTLHHGGKQVFEYVSTPALKTLAGKAKPGTPLKK